MDKMYDHCNWGCSVGIFVILRPMRRWKNHKYKKIYVKVFWIPHNNSASIKRDFKFKKFSLTLDSYQNYLFS